MEEGVGRVIFSTFIGFNLRRYWLYGAYPWKHFEMNTFSTTRTKIFPADLSISYVSHGHVIKGLGSFPRSSLGTISLSNISYISSLLNIYTYIFCNFWYYRDDKGSYQALKKLFWKEMTRKIIETTRKYCKSRNEEVKNKSATDTDWTFVVIIIV